ncbi:MAG TPA: DUF2914 domain-containing protein [Candidatus Paceibacterota bacterium]
MKKTVQTFKDWYLRHERLARALAFAFGFLFDSLTLTRADLLYTNLILTAYLVAAAGGIIILFAEPRMLKVFGTRVREWFELGILFCFGTLMSGYVVLYVRSGSLSDSWPFLAVLAALFIGNELFRKYYQFLVFQLSMLFVAIFSYLIFSLPVLFKQIGVGIFLLSGIASLAAFAGVVGILWRIDPKRMHIAYRRIVASTAVIFILFNVAYFTNTIPPIPLALKEIGIYHQVLPGIEGTYRLTYEPSPWYLRLFGRTSTTYHWQKGEPIFAYSAVFAPTKLTATIFHEWLYFDETTSAWVPKAHISFPITGGRDGGYRGYSLKESVLPGRWRIEVRTEREALIGRMSFTVVAEAPGTLVTRKD